MPADCHTAANQDSSQVHPQLGANFDSRFVSREGAKNAKEKACDGFSVPSLEKVSSATEFRHFCNYSGHPFFQRETRHSFPRRGKEWRVSREILIWA
jgi:hypothetical protein